MIEDTDPGLDDGPTLEEARLAAAVIASEPEEDTDELPEDVRDGEAHE
jgi:hypothetical protein